MDLQVAKSIDEYVECSGFVNTYCALKIPHWQYPCKHDTHYHNTLFHFQLALTGVISSAGEEGVSLDK